MTILVIAEHDNASIKAATLNTVAAATKIGGDIHVLVAGSNAQAAADAAAKIAGVSKVLLADAPQLAEGLAENVEGTVAGHLIEKFALARVQQRATAQVKSPGYKRGPFLLDNLT
jgi:electron transfer flavoprotein alpha subunit